MKRIHIIALFILSEIIISFTQCTKEAERDFARVRTLDASDITQYGATINGEVLNFETSQITECGFNLYTGIPSEQTFAGVGIADYNNKTGKFSYAIETGLVDGHVYYYEAYAKVDPVLTVGNQMSFESMGSPIPIPVDFNPKTGQAGDTIALLLEKDIFIASGYAVEFNGIRANTVGFEGPSLKVEVPHNLTSRESTVSIKFNNQTVSFDDQFVLLTPEIISFSPSSVYSGQYVTIEGNNFNKITSLNTVRFNTTSANVISSTKTTLVVITPNIFDPQASLTIEVSGQSTTASETIEVLGEPILWSQVANFPVSVYRAQGFAIDGYGYAGMGDTGSSIKQFWRYDPSSDNWSPIADFPGPARISPVTSSINGFGYVGGGLSKSWNRLSSLKDYYSYNPTFDQWQAIADNPAPTDDNFVEFFATVGDKLFVFTTPFSFYSLSDNPISWDNLSGTGPSFWSASASFAIDDKIYVVLSKNYPNLINEVWMYNTTDLSWQRLNDFPGTARIGAVGFSINGNGYIGLGYDGANRLADIWEYYPNNDSWTRLADDYPGGETSSAFVFVIDNNAYVGTGVSGIITRKNSVYRFTPLH